LKYTVLAVALALDTSQDISELAVFLAIVQFAWKLAFQLNSVTSESMGYSSVLAPGTNAIVTAFLVILLSMISLEIS